MWLLLANHGQDALFLLYNWDAQDRTADLHALNIN